MPEKDIAVVIERIEGLKALIHEKFDDNKDEHREIITHQKETNGNVRRNTNWRYYMMGAIGVLTGVVLPTAFIVLKEVLK